MKTKLYPLQFEPILKEKIWGGTKLKEVLNKPITSNTTGESWEISTVENDISVVSNGVLKGETLNQLIEQFPTEILGDKVISKFGKQFPLLFKFLDAREDLSIQVHPNDELAKKRHNSLGKTEMWYVMQADSDAQLIIGFKENSSKEDFLQHLQKNSLLEVLDSKKVKHGDAFFLATGTVHAVGAGTVIAEIQQTSDITYRLYDFDRVDTTGNKRELHIDLALAAINYNKINAERAYTKIENTSNEMVACDYFTTHFIPLNGTYAVHRTNDSFYVYMCVEGTFELELENKKYSYKKGDTLLIPASLDNYSLIGCASLLEIYIS
ncbi:type I phosphomannose isomerase catalytic subunit [Flavobacterium sp.]